MPVIVPLGWLRALLSGRTRLTNSDPDWVQEALELVEGGRNAGSEKAGDDDDDDREKDEEEE